jgi:hypothetical protein
MSITLNLSPEVAAGLLATRKSKAWLWNIGEYLSPSQSPAHPGRVSERE